MSQLLKTWSKCPLREGPHGRRPLASAMACGPSSRARLHAGRWYDSGTGQSHVIKFTVMQVLYFFLYKIWQLL